MQINISYIELLDLIRQLPFQDISRLQQDIQQLSRIPQVSLRPISSLRGRVSTQTNLQIDQQINSLRNEWNDTF